MRKRGFSKISAAWLIAAISATIVMASAIYFIYFAQQPKQRGESDIRVDAIATPSRHERADEPITPIAKPTNLNPDKIELGRALFHDPRLSKDDTVSCASCHDLMRGGVDRLKFSVGVDSKQGDLNAPSVYNSSINFRQFWDGRARDLEEQAAGPIFNPVEMASEKWEDILPKLQSDASLVDNFEKIYGEPPNKSNIIDAIVEFEKSLITPSRFDRWLLGDDSAITAEELEGYRLFVRHGCVACHQGEGVGGNLYQRFGVMRDYYSTHDINRLSKGDLGRFNVTGREEDRFVFKVPILRNIELTEPYFHDASSSTLEGAVARMGLFQLGVELPAEDVESIAKFLKTLTGEELQ